MCPPSPDRPGVSPIARLCLICPSLSAGQHPLPLQPPSRFPGDVTRALALHSGSPLPAARRTSLAQMQRPWPQSGSGGCWQRLCSRREAEEGGLGARWGRQGSGVTGTKARASKRVTLHPSLLCFFGLGGCVSPGGSAPWRDIWRDSPSSSTFPVPGGLGDPLGSGPQPLP